jgi:hypothetical protein
MSRCHGEKELGEEGLGIDDPVTDLDRSPAVGEAASQGRQTVRTIKQTMTERGKMPARDLRAYKGLLPSVLGLETRADGWLPSWFASCRIGAG